MTLDDIPVFSMLKRRMEYLADRQQVIAQNVANSDTPGYAPMDLKPFQLPGQGGLGGGGALPMVATTMTSPMHLSPPGMGGFKDGRHADDKPVVSPDTETTLDGNSVVLEDEMMKMSQARIDYDAAVSFYQQSLQLIQTAVKRPGT